MVPSKSKYIGFSILVTSLMAFLFWCVGASQLLELAKGFPWWSFLFQGGLVLLGASIIWGLVEVFQAGVEGRSGGSSWSWDAFWSPWSKVWRFLGSHFDAIFAIILFLCIWGVVGFGVWYTAQEVVKRDVWEKQVKAEIQQYKADLEKTLAVNAALEEKVASLTRDNIAYQKTIKDAAAVGIKVPHHPR